MDELLWGKEFEDVHEWVERLKMVVEVKGIDELKLYKIGKLNLRGKSKEWFKKLVGAPTTWQDMKATMLLKYVFDDKENIRVKLDMIKQKPKQKLQTYYDWMDKLFAKGKLEDVEQRR
jgi:hypothetical protein